MADTISLEHSLEKIKAFWHSQVHDSDKWELKMKGTTVLFALWPDHISARSDGRTVFERSKKSEHDEEYVHIWEGDAQKMFLFGNNILCFVGVYAYCKDAYDMLIEKIKEIGHGIIDKEVLTKAFEFVQKNYVENFVKDPDDGNDYKNCFPSSIFLVGFDGEHYLGEEENKPKTHSVTIDEKEVRFICCGGGASIAKEHLVNQFDGRRKLNTISEVSELLSESLVVTSLNDGCTGGTFKRIEYHLGGTPSIYDEGSHVIEEIVKHYDFIDLDDSACIPIHSKFDRGAMEEEYVFQKDLKTMLPGIHRIMNMGGCEADNNFAMRLLFFTENKDYEEALKKLKGPPMIDNINGVGIFWEEYISKHFCETIISGWGKQKRF